MRILILTNLYPPHHIGGYELGCKDVVEGLRKKGHEITVLTSTYGIDRPRIDGHVYRYLLGNFNWKQSFRNKLTRVSTSIRMEKNNQMAFKELCSLFKPDIVYAWNLSEISISLGYLANHLALPVAYYISGPWLSDLYIQRQRIVHRLGDSLFYLFLKYLHLHPPKGPLNLTNVQFCSQFLKNRVLKHDLSISNAKVIHWGIDINAYPYKKLAPRVNHLLYVGQIVPHKGVHTAVEALRILRQRYDRDVFLTIAGGTVMPDYEAHLQCLIKSSNLERFVHFTGPLQRELLHSVYQQHEVLVFPSIWDEPFSITLLEAMSSGLGIVGTTMGGSIEILRDSINALVFEMEDAENCAAQIEVLINNPPLFNNIRYNARNTIEKHFKLENMVDKIETALFEAIRS